ncbi:hypothetical protein LSH36_449g01023 [Paralvinella palmiformis]|uniref:Uncharacterized protein n=1 Tax=Paralvinella palmiformis TaxID=53620 RepID=A0AAD9JAH0_9ANNE|nr:hypothetical protein LSH36_449g01023 [Paralvinella palmiformis]
MIRDKVVFSIANHERSLKQKLLDTTDLTLSKTKDLCLAYEVTQNEVRSMGADGIEERALQHVIITDGDLTKIKIIVQQVAVNQKLVILPVNTIHATDVDHHIMIIEVSALHMVPLAINVLVKIITRLCVIQPNQDQHMS